MNVHARPKGKFYTLQEVEIACDRVECARSFATFVKRSWHVVEPKSRLRWGWALDAMCEHLEAVSVGEILRLLMNVPPGMMKSLMCGVFWPAWEWGPFGRPDLRFIGTAHRQDLAVRDNLKCRRLIKSDWYQKRWPHVVLTEDQDEKKRFENTASGFRAAMPFTSMTGERGDRVLLDDPHSADGANSPAELLNVRTTFKETLPTRVNDDNSAIVVIMQRLNSNDVSGIILEEELGYEHLMLPMRFEKDRRCSTSIGFTDPRTEEGELLAPKRFPEQQVQELERVLGSYGTAGQLQQRPVPREGAMFRRDWFASKFIDAAEIPRGTRWVRHWDLAATKDKTAARTAGVRLGITPDGEYIVGHLLTMQEEGPQVKRAIVNTAASDPHGTIVSLPQDPGQAGKVQKRDFAAALAGYTFTIVPETGDKETRAMPFAAQCEAGNVYIVRGPWNDMLLDELCLFPGGKFKDIVDALSGAFGRLITRPAVQQQSKVVVLI